MKAEVRDISWKVNAEEWRHLSDTSPTYSFFQTQGCLEFLKSLSFVEAFAFYVYEDECLKGVLLGFVNRDRNPVRNFFTRRAIVNGGPLLADDISEEALMALLRTCVSSLKRKAIYVECRNYSDYSKWKSCFERCGFEYKPHYDFQVDTSSMETVLLNTGKSRLRDTKTSLKNGALIEDNPSQSDISSFYSLLHHLYAKKIKTPLFPYEFFEKLHGLKDGYFRLVRLNGKIIGGTVCVGEKGRILYEWFACGLDCDLKNIHPSTLATYSGIELAVENCCRMFDMMGAGSPGDGGYGVRDFKAKFGGKLVENGRFLCVQNTFLYRVGVIGVKILKMLK